MSLPERGEPFLRSADQVPGLLGSFFSSGRAAAGTQVELSAGLWPLLSWCWSLEKKKRQRSALCQFLIGLPGQGWKDEADVVEAMARSSHPLNPASLPPERVQDFAAALLQEGEQARGHRSRLQVHLSFLLPRIDSHPLFSTATIRNALQMNGAPQNKVEEHVKAVHPERRSYEGTWILTLHDALHDAAHNRRTSRSDGVVHRVPIRDPDIGQRTRLSLHLHHETELDGYFRLSFLTARGDAFVSEPKTQGQGSS